MSAFVVLLTVDFCRESAVTECAGVVQDLEMSSFNVCVNVDTVAGLVVASLTDESPIWNPLNVAFNIL